jgi:RNA polymerase sigma-70 factor (ECF subfamily)
MASAPTSRTGPAASAAVQAFVASHYGESGAAQFGIDAAGLAAMLAEVFEQRGAGSESDAALQSLRLEELVLARACVAGNERAWEIFMARFREAMYDAAYKIAHDEASGRALADSLYAELYGLTDRGDGRASKLQYYQGRGSLLGWLRTVMAQEYVNQYRRTRRETSLEAAVEEGKQFAAHETSEQQTDSRIEAATVEELAALEAEERFVLTAYFIDRHTLAEIARVMGVHESTISRKLERATTGLRKRIRKRLIDGGMSARQADEAMQDADVRDLNINIGESLGQERDGWTFYKKSGEEG